MSVWYESILACPDCRDPLTIEEEQVRCSGCRAGRPRARPLELHPSRSTRRSLDVQTGFDPESMIDGIDLSAPEPTYEGPSGSRYANELLTCVQDLLSPASQVLEVGCANRDQSAGIEHLGHEYVGLDPTSDHADIRGDAHALPFVDASLDFVFAYAVLEHLHNPFLAMNEIARVLRPGGLVWATVSQGEPFHDSYFHHTLWGLLAVLHGARLAPERVWSSGDTLASLAEMGKYPRVIRAGIAAIGMTERKLPFLAPRKLGWPQRQKQLADLHTAASIVFLARKPAETATEGRH